MGVSNWKMVWWAIFSSLPQPIGAVLAFTFVRIAREFLVISEFIPEALERGVDLPGGGYRELTTGLAVGILLMIPLVFV